MGLKVFLDYGHDGNTDLVHRIKVDLEAAGHTPWLDTSEIEHGDDWRRLREQGGLSDALAAYRAGLAIDERPARETPDNAQAQRDLFISYQEVTRLSAITGDCAAARTAAAKAETRAGLLFERLPPHTVRHASDPQGVEGLLRDIADACP